MEGNFLVEVEADLVEIENVGVTSTYEDVRETILDEIMWTLEDITDEVVKEVRKPDPDTDRAQKLLEIAADTASLFKYHA